MDRETASSRDADRLLSGDLDPGVDPGLAHLAALIAAAQAPASPSELMDEATVVAAMLKDLSPVVAFESRRASRIKKVAAAQISAAALLAVTATMAAAAGTGSLPGAAQRAVAGAVGHIGIDVPNGHKHGGSNGNSGSNGGGSSDSPAATAGSGANGSGPNANADFGLCTAFLAAPQGQGSDHSSSADHSQSDNAAAFKALAAAHPDTTSYCNTVIQEKRDTTSGGSNGNSGSNGKSGSNGNSGATGQPASPGKSDSSGKPSTPPGNSGQPQGKPATTPGQNGGKPSTTSTSGGTSTTATTNNGGHPQGGGAAGGGQPNRP